MNPRIASLPLLGLVCLSVGFGQPAKPSINIGEHVLTLGMAESTVLDQLGTDLILKKLPAGVKPKGAENPPASAWIVQRKTESGFVEVGSVTFDDHRLTDGHTALGNSAILREISFLRCQRGNEEFGA
jgi:hypothetical protein